MLVFAIFCFFTLLSESLVVSSDATQGYTTWDDYNHRYMNLEREPQQHFHPKLPVETCGERPRQSRTRVNGPWITLRQNPAFVQVHVKHEFKLPPNDEQVRRCGGTLIASDLVLTAASCINPVAGGKVKAIKVMRNTKDKYQYNVTNICLSRGFKYTSNEVYENDLAVIRITRISGDSSPKKTPSKVAMPITSKPKTISKNPNKKLRAKRTLTGDPIYEEDLTFGPDEQTGIYNLPTACISAEALKPDMLAYTSGIGDQANFLQDNIRIRHKSDKLRETTVNVTEGCSHPFNNEHYICGKSTLREGGATCGGKLISLTQIS